MAETNGKSAYTSARKLGKKYLSEHANGRYKGYLPTLDEKIGDVEITGEINLGYHEIPLNKIIGTRTSARSTAFAGNFMPVLNDDSEFALKWQSLYESHLKDGIRDPVKLYEYLNRYYVQEGNKRVSVLNSVGAASVYGSVIRLIPKRDESNKDISIYYEFLDFDRRQVFDNLWFTHRGGFTYLVNQTVKYKKHHPDVKDSEGDLIRSVHRVFREAYKRAGYDDIKLTTGDALVAYIDVFGYPRNETVSDIFENIKKARAQFEAAANMSETITIEAQRPATHSLAKSLFQRKKIVKVAFAFEGTPDKNPWTRLHDTGYRRILRKYGDDIQVSCAYDVPKNPKDSYDVLSGLIKEEPDILFATSPNMSTAANRLTLENPGRIILNCDMAQEGKMLNTYFAKSHDASFVCGVLAGAMSRSDKLGFMSSSLFRNSLYYDVNAFALGAQIVNPRVQVMEYRLTKEKDFEEYAYAVSEFAKWGADVAYCQHFMYNPAARKAFPTIYAQIYVLNMKKGVVDECIGAAACDWSVFYDSIVGDTVGEKGSLLSTFPGLDNPVHFGWGLNTGLMEVYGVDAFMGHNATRLLGIFRGLLRRGRLHPFTGPIFDTDGNQRIEAGDTPTLTEIQNMDWYVLAVKKVM